MHEIISEIAANPIDFLSQHVLFCNSAFPSAKYNIKSADSDFGSVKGMNGQMGSIYLIELQATSKYSINSGELAWLKYRPGATTTLDLYGITSAHLILTDKLTGCSFGFMRWRTGGVRIAHANHQTIGGDIDVEANRLAMVGYNSIKKSSYIKQNTGVLGAEAGLTYGVWHNKKWNFYLQRLKDFAGGYGEIVSVEIIPG